MDASGRYKNFGTERKDLITHGNINSQSNKIIFQPFSEPQFPQENMKRVK